MVRLNEKFKKGLVSNLNSFICDATGEAYDDTQAVQKKHFFNTWKLVEIDVKFRSLMAKSGQKVG